MPWQNVTPMEEINRFVVLACSGRFSVTDLCEQFGISRKTGYKHLERYAALGLAGLQPRSHLPHHSPQRTDEAVAALILAERRQHRTWGPKKLPAVLERKPAIEQPPACSTMAEILRRHGLSARRRRRPGSFAAGNDCLTRPTQPNQIWTVDSKGWFLLGNQQRCDPLTVCDRHSHYVLACDASPNQQFKSTLHAFRGLMRHHGLPEIIRCDLGSLFASNGLGRFSSLSLWWIEQGSNRSPSNVRPSRFDWLQSNRIGLQFLRIELHSHRIGLHLFRNELHSRRNELQFHRIRLHSLRNGLQSSRNGPQSHRNGLQFHFNGLQSLRNGLHSHDHIPQSGDHAPQSHDDIRQLGHYRPAVPF